MLKVLNKKQKRMLLIMIITALVIVPGTFSLYRSGLRTEVSGISGKLKADIVLEQDDSYLEDNIPYFYVIVKNHLNDVLTDVNLDYTVTIKNKNNSEGIFSDDNSNYSATKQLTGTFGKSAKEEKKYKIYVDTNNTEETQVDFDAELSVVQKKMD